MTAIATKAVQSIQPIFSTSHPQIQPSRDTIASPPPRPLHSLLFTNGHLRLIQKSSSSSIIITMATTIMAGILMEVAQYHHRSHHQIHNPIRPDYSPVPWSYHPMGRIHRGDGYWFRWVDGLGGHDDRRCILFLLRVSKVMICARYWGQLDVVI